MQPHGSDRVRAAGAKVILHSRLAKGWTPRTPKSLTHAEHPGTTVMWGEEYFEVVAADALPAGGVRYVLEKWRDEHVIRTFQRYDEASEAQLAAEFAQAERQRRRGRFTRIIGIFAGHLPSPVQNHLGNELGVSPARMTLLSCIPPVVLVGVLAMIEAGARIDREPSRIPLLLWIVVGFLFLESGIRFFVAMSQGRPMGSLLGTVVYAIVHLLAGRKTNLPKPLEERGEGAFFMIPPPEDVALRDSLSMRGPMLTLLPAGEQVRLARVLGFDYREHAFALTWTILAVSVIGAGTSFVKVQHGGGASALLSLVAAVAVAAEQIARLIALQRGPAGSVLGIFVRPFVRDLLARR